MKHFNETLLDIARDNYSTVYVDTVTPEAYYGSETSYAGDRIRLYPTSWDYETPIIFYSDSELKEYLANDILLNGTPLFNPYLDDTIDTVEELNSIVSL